MHTSSLAGVFVWVVFCMLSQSEFTWVHSPAAWKGCLLGLSTTSGSSAFSSA